MRTIQQNSGIVNDFDIEQVKQQTSKKLVNVHREGRNRLRAQCPNCKAGSERGRSFYTSAKVNYQFWHCHTCDHKATTSSILGLAFVTEARPVVADYVDGSIPTAKLNTIRQHYRSLADFAHAQLLNTPHALQYLYDRGVTDGAIALYQLGYVDRQLYQQWCESLTYTARQSLAWAGLPDVAEKTRFSGHAAMFAAGHKGKIVFPYADEIGNIQDIRTRSISNADTNNGKAVRYTSPKHGQDDRGVEIPYGVIAMGDAARVLITEGEFKSIIPTAHDAGPILALRGTSDRLETYLPILRGKHAILAFDNDEKRNKFGLTAGESATITHARLLIANGISVTVVRPSDYGEYKGIDDLVHGAGPDALAALVQPGQTLTLSEFEAELTRGGADLSGRKHPKPDAGVKRLWTPAQHVDRHLQQEQNTVTVDEAQEQIEQAVADHLTNYHGGNDQLMITATAGTGKTTSAINIAKRLAAENDDTIAVSFPSHSTIDEKIVEGLLEGFQHVYGRRWDDDIQNCEQADKAQALTAKGYSPALILCPSCPFLGKCRKEGYISQFNGKANRAYVHQHLFTDRPETEDIVIADELSHRSFVDDMRVYLGDMANALQSAEIAEGPRTMLEAILNLYHRSDIATMGGFEFYERLEREFSDLRNIDYWGDGDAVQTSLNDLAVEFSDSAYRIDELPDQFGEKLFSMLASDVREIKAGRSPSGRVRFVVPHSGDRYIDLAYSQGRFPAWYGKRPTVILNATADADMMNDLIGPIKTIAPVADVADGNEIIQDVTRNNAKFWLQGGTNEANRQRWFKQIRQNITDEADTTIITTKSLESYVKAEFPLAKVAYFLGLEGRNDLQSSTTILANSPPVNMGAIQREGVALYPGLDDTLTRSISAFAYSDADNRNLSVEQIDAVDPRLQGILDQHRDAVVVQAVHRSRIVRQTGRRVVALFSRPIPGIRPTQVITERPDGPTKATQRKQDILQRLTDAAHSLSAEDGGFALSALANCADVSRPTANKYWGDVVGAIPDLNYMDVLCIQPMSNGGSKRVTVRVAIRSDISDHVMGLHSQGDTNGAIDAIAECVGRLIPATWLIDYESYGIEPPHLRGNTMMHEENACNDIDIITSVSLVHHASIPIPTATPFDIDIGDGWPESAYLEGGGD